MKTQIQPDMRIPQRQISDLALGAAKEISRGLKTRQRTDELSRRIPNFFVSSGSGVSLRPQMRPESIGLVCDVLEQWKGETTIDYSELSVVAKQVAKKLATRHPSAEDRQKLVKFCLSLHNATRSRPEFYEVQPQHRYLATLA